MRSPGRDGREHSGCRGQPGARPQDGAGQAELLRREMHRQDGDVHQRDVRVLLTREQPH